jgi:hypothetical protein
MFVIDEYYKEHVRSCPGLLYACSCGDLEESRNMMMSTVRLQFPEYGATTKRNSVMG